MQTMTMMYYPFVHPPRTVLWQALLYWDELTSIAPRAEYRFGRDLVVLEDRGLYRPTHADYLPSRKRADLVNDLLQVVQEGHHRRAGPRSGGQAAGLRPLTKAVSAENLIRATRPGDIRE